MSRTNRNATCVCALNMKPKCWDAGGQLEVLFRFFSLEKNDLSVTCCDEAVSLLKQCLRSVGEDLKHL